VVRRSTVSGIVTAVRIIIVSGNVIPGIFNAVAYSSKETFVFVLSVVATVLTVPVFIVVTAHVTVVAHRLAVVIGVTAFRGVAMTETGVVIIVVIHPTVAVAALVVGAIHVGSAS